MGLDPPPVGVLMLNYKGRIILGIEMTPVTSSPDSGFTVRTVNVITFAPSAIYPGSSLRE